MGFAVFVEPNQRFVRGHVLVGAVRADITVKLIVVNWTGDITLWSGNYLSGDVSSDELAHFKDFINRVAEKFGYPPLGPDWVNGSWTGILAEELPSGYAYSIIEHDGKVYVYYTIQRPDGTAWISGYVFDGLNAAPASTPEFQGVGVASPFLFKLVNGPLAMMWASVSSVTDLSELTINLQLAVFENNTWSNPINITGSGIAWAYTSDGEYIYVIFSPSITSDLYGNTVLRAYSVNGSLIWERELPYAMTLNGAFSGKVVVGFTNGTYSIVGREETTYIGHVTEAGIIPGAKLIYVYSDGVLRLFNETWRIELSIEEAYAWPIIVNDRLFVVTYTPPALRLHYWNGSSLINMREYLISNVTAVNTAHTSENLYLCPFSLRDLDNATIWCVIIPITPPQISLHVDQQGDNIVINWRVKDYEQYNITSIQLTIYRDNTVFMREEISPEGSKTVKLTEPGNYIVEIKVKTILGDSSAHQTLSITKPVKEEYLFILVTVILIIIIGAILLAKRKREKQKILF